MLLRANISTLGISVPHNRQQVLDVRFYFLSHVGVSSQCMPLELYLISYFNADFLAILFAQYKQKPTISRPPVFPMCDSKFYFIQCYTEQVDFTHNAFDL